MLVTVVVAGEPDGLTIGRPADGGAIGPGGVFVFVEQFGFAGEGVEEEQLFALEVGAGNSVDQAARIGRPLRAGLSPDAGAERTILQGDGLGGIERDDKEPGGGGRGAGDGAGEGERGGEAAGVIGEDLLAAGGAADGIEDALAVGRPLVLADAFGIGKLSKLAVSEILGE